MGACGHGALGQATNAETTRIGRRLKPNDFVPDHAFNGAYFPASKRLRNRRGRRPMTSLTWTRDGRLSHPDMDLAVSLAIEVVFMTYDKDQKY
jgi:hypothetical protein